jgi:Rrf2 family transcriptional regulator, iron-sulfur cluster assembly transcription factor
MIRLTKKLLFAIEAVLDIAYNGGQAPVRSSEITEREGIPRRYLEPVLQELVRHKILLGIRGPSGGYRLARERRRIRSATRPAALSATKSCGRCGWSCKRR